MRRALWTGLALGALLTGVRGQPEPQQESSRQAETPAPESALTRVVVLGASMSAGFGLRSDLAAVLEASLQAPHETLRAQATELFFTNPRGLGGQAIEFALDAEPTLVLALDYLFWFGYGAQNARGEPIGSEDERLELLEVGLEFLDELECPLIVADFPDMKDAVGKMLAESQMPRPETLGRLSARVHAWAARREHTLVLPMAAAVTALKSDAEVHLGRHTWPAGTRLLQADELHPNAEGMVGVVQWVADAVVRAGWAREQDFLFDREAVLGKLRGGRPAGIIPVR